MKSGRSRLAAANGGPPGSLQWSLRPHTSVAHTDVCTGRTFRAHRHTDTPTHPTHAHAPRLSNKDMIAF